MRGSSASPRASYHNTTGWSLVKLGVYASLSRLFYAHSASHYRWNTKEHMMLQQGHLLSSAQHCWQDAHSRFPPVPSRHATSLGPINIRLGPFAQGRRRFCLSKEVGRAVWRHLLYLQCILRPLPYDDWAETGRKSRVQQTCQSDHRQQIVPDAG